MQPRQTDAVDQFVAREANGYKAEGFSRQRVFISMNRSEESNLPGITSVRSISRYESALFRSSEARAALASRSPRFFARSSESLRARALPQTGPPAKEPAEQCRSRA